MALLLALPLARAGDEPGAPPELHWPIPVLRIGGVLAYDTRRESGFARDGRQDGVAATVNVATNTWLWEPWFARLDANLGVTMARNDSDGHEAAIFRQTRSAFGTATGSARLSVLPGTRFPFELHIDRSDSRASTELALGNEHVGRRIGFVQQYQRAEGNAMIGWDRSTQDGSGGRASQDSTRFTLSQVRPGHRLQLMGDGARNTRSRGDEVAAQDNLTVQYGYTPPESALSLDTLANVSRNEFRLVGGDSRSDLSQLSSIAMWRSAESDLSVVGGLRLFALDAAAGKADPDNGGARLRNANLNGGVNYDLTHALRLSASANLNHAQTNRRRESGANQSAGATYQPDPQMLGSTRYGWSAGVHASNRSGQESGQQLSVQLSHNMARSLRLDSGAALYLDGSQSLSALANRSTNARIAGNARQLSHSGSLSWDLAREESGSSSLRMTASDTRELGGAGGYFQMVNLQLSSNLGASAYSSFSGNLTLQAVRQSERLVGASDPLARLAPRPGWVTLSSGSLSYQQQRLFGVPRLQFGSDLRLNSAALLPVLGKASDQQTAAWENRLTYSIGRTTIRFIFVVARSPVQPDDAALPGGGRAGPEQKMGRAAMFNLSRGFGQF